MFHELVKNKLIHIRYRAGYLFMNAGIAYFCKMSLDIQEGIQFILDMLNAII